MQLLSEYLKMSSDWGSIPARGLLKGGLLHHVGRTGTWIFLPSEAPGSAAARDVLGRGLVRMFQKALGHCHWGSYCAIKLRCSWPSRWGRWCHHSLMTRGLIVPRSHRTMLWHPESWSRDSAPGAARWWHRSRVTARALRRSWEQLDHHSGVGDVITW